MSAERIQLRRIKGWRLPEGAKSVARPTRWGNPFPVARDPMGELFQREDAVRMFSELVTTGEAWFEGHRFRSPYPSAEIHELAGLDLACWCPLDEPCHADVLLALANPEQPK